MLSAKTQSTAAVAVLALAPKEEQQQIKGAKASVGVAGIVVGAKSPA
jgi:hypothetical protein